jgi:hypothetical protein
MCKIGAQVLDPVKRCARQTGKVKLQENNFVTLFFLLTVLSVKITSCMEDKMVTLRALSKLNMQNL